MNGGNKMSLHAKSDKLRRKQKYADQFARTARNKKKRIERAEVKKGSK